MRLLIQMKMFDGSTNSSFCQQICLKGLIVAIALSLFPTKANAAQFHFDLVVTSAGNTENTANGGNSTALRFDGETGTFLGQFAVGDSVSDPRDIVPVPPDGATLNINNGDDRILTYNSQTGDFLGEFAFLDGLNPGGSVFAPNGNYLVGARTSGSIVEFDRETGQFLRNFIAPGQVTFPRGFDFGADGKFFYLGNGADPVSGDGGGSIVQFDGTTGDVINPNFINDPNFSPLDVAIAPDNSLFVSSEFPFGDANSVGTVRRYDSNTGELLQVFDAGLDEEGQPLLSQPRGIGFGPDGNLYVSSTGTDSVVRFNQTTGQYVDTFVRFPNLNGQGLTFVPRQKANSIPEPASVLGLIAFGVFSAFSRQK
jgi:WD40 repeat protein